MTEIIAYCGLDCVKCRGYQATRRRDRALATEIAELWSTGPNESYTAEDIWCDGCFSDRLHTFCARCQVRICGKKKLENCGKCSEYPCEKLRSLWGSWVESSPAAARANLERVRARIPP